MNKKFFQKNKFQTVLVFAFFLAYLCRIGAIREALKIDYYYFSVFRVIVYFAVIIGWGVSLKNRINNKNLRRSMLVVCFLMALWMWIKTTKYDVFYEGAVNRFLWYLFYLPMLFIPLFCLYGVLYIGKDDTYSISKKMYLMTIVNGLLLAFVLTNDLHGQVFAFYGGVENYSDMYKYGWGYIPIVVSMVVNVLACLGIIFMRCRISNKKRLIWKPIFPIIAIVIYAVSYILRIDIVINTFGDMTAFNCACIVWIFESLIVSGLIKSNRNYKELFHISTINGEIFDNDYNPRYKTAVAGEFDRETVTAMNEHSVVLDNGMRLTKERITGGYFVWGEDISSLLAIIAKLDETKEELEEFNSLIQEEYNQQAKTVKLQEQNEIYDEMQRQTVKQIKMLSEYISAVKECTSEAEARKLLGYMIVVGAYVKRRNNLIFISRRDKRVSLKEIRACFDESMRSLTAYGVDCGAVIDENEGYKWRLLVKAYDFFERVTEHSLKTLKSLMVNVVSLGEGIGLSVAVECDEDFSPLKNDYSNLDITVDEDGITYLFVNF